MEKEALKRIFEFLEEKGEHNAPFLWKLLNNIPLTKEDLIVNDDLDLSETYIKSLPKGLKVYGDLDLTLTDIEFLPKGLEVRGDLILDGCANIKSLPKGLKVGGNLELTGITLGEDYDDDELRQMIKPGFIKGEIRRKW